MTKVWQRARNEEQKQQRRSALLAAATRMLENQAMEEVSLNAIAREANVSKANVYRYFESREELFMTLMLEALRRWQSDVIESLREGEPSSGARHFAETMSATALRHADYSRMTTILSNVSR